VKKILLQVKLQLLWMLSRGASGAHFLERRITAGDADKSQQCHKNFFQYSKFASERLQVRTWDAKLASCPGRHLTSFHPCNKHHMVWRSSHELTSFK